MKNRKLALAAAGIGLVTLVTAGIAADKPQQSMQEMMRQHHGMQGSGSYQQGMMGCPMMGGGMMGGMMGRQTSGGHLPQLPPGNEKLQLQMHAEIMQKVGEIMAKYANQIPSR